MQKCPKCLAEQNNVNSRACYYCGADMGDAVDTDTNNSSSYTEASEYIPEQNITLPDSDDLGIETTADLMESEAHELATNENNFDSQSSPYPNTFKRDPSIKETNQEDVHGIKKLTDSEIKEIEQSLYKKSDFINNKEKSDLIEKISSVGLAENKPFSNQPIDPHNIDKSEFESVQETSDEEVILPKPQIAKKGQGLAYFYNNFIQIQGSQKLYTDDILSVNNREYILKPKKINPKTIIYAATAALICIITLFGSIYLGNSDLTNGQVFGVILDESDTPYIDGATVVFTELGKRSISDNQGMFTFTNIPVGAHKIEYQINGNTIGSDYITIADNSKSFITLRPNVEVAKETVDPLKKLVNASNELNHKQETTKKNITQKETVKKQEPKTVVQTKTKTKEVATNTSKSKTTTPSKPKPTGYGKLALNANVDGAKIKIDGNVLGAGNLTYSKIKTGNHTYSVSMDGYETVTGSFEIKDGETKQLSPVLTMLTKREKEKTYKTDDYFYSAENAFNSGEYKTAIEDYKKVIEKSPSAAEAYYGIAESYSQLKIWDQAYDNYIRAAEIHLFKNRTSIALTCYNNAIDVDNEKVTAYLGRANTLLLTGEYRAALGDFDKVVSLDRRNFAAYYGLGEASFKLQRYSKAIKYFKDARTLQEDNPSVHQYLTLAYMFEHDQKNTQKSFEKFNELASEQEKENFKKNGQYSAVTKLISSE